MTDSDEMDLLYHKIDNDKYYYTLYYYPDDLLSLYLYDFEVAPKYQCKRLGSQILKSLIHNSATEFDRIFLWCENDWHVDFYQRFGFDVFDHFTIDDGEYANMVLELNHNENEEAPVHRESPT